MRKMSADKTVYIHRDANEDLTTHHVHHVGKILKKRVFPTLMVRMDIILPCEEAGKTNNHLVIGLDSIILF